ncbi:hypothetical protein RVR_174 [Actinacidiphila reveromycinica]|uniref:Uncharacterized protein n=1 Tax=Actinacidiphila reveromycinica TaxID=659352 RepID=A0A7U3UML2_9ACTN|nr:hypothetical protein RVR_174 [Streptomyces sp. SN-593]
MRARARAGRAGPAPAGARDDGPARTRQSSRPAVRPPACGPASRALRTPTRGGTITSEGAVEHAPGPS